MTIAHLLHILPSHLWSPLLRPLKSYNLLSRWLCYLVTAAALVSLTSCGGGGGQTLAVSFDYTGVDTSLFTPIDSIPSLDGLQGKTPSCSLTSGALPPGETLASNCAIVGTPTQLGNFNATVTLTVDGFDGSVSSPVTAGVVEPTLTTVRDLSVTQADQQVQLGASVKGMKVVTLTTASLGTYVPQPGDSLHFAITSGAAPKGLMLDPALGTLSGVPSEFGVSTMTLALTITHAGISFTTKPVSTSISTYEAPFTLAYPSCCATVNVGDSINLAPISTYVPVQGATVLFTSGAVPGVTVDPTAGVLSGYLTTGGEYPLGATEKVTYPDGTVAYATSNAIVLEVMSPEVEYDGFDHQVLPNTSFSYGPTSISNVLPGETYSFSIVPTPGSTSSGNIQSGTPLPPWLNVDLTTGRLFGTVPASSTTIYQWEVDVIMTTIRDKRSYTSKITLEFDIG